MNIETFYTAMRVVLGDNDPQGSFEFTDDMLGDAIRTAYVLGGFPKGYALDAIVGGTQISPEVTNVKHFALILLEACIAMMVGDQGAFSFQTRAISQTDHGERKRDILQFARLKIHTLSEGDAVFSTRASLVSFLHTIDGYDDLATITNTGSLNVSLGLGADQNLFL